MLMHMHGTPRTMQQAPHYDDVVGEIVENFLDERIRFAMARWDCTKTKSFLIQVSDLVSCWYITLTLLPNCAVRAV